MCCGWPRARTSSDVRAASACTPNPSLRTPPHAAAFSQYAIIRGVAVTAVAVAVGAVFAAVLLVTGSLAVAGTTAAGVLSIAVCLVGWVWALNPV